jgi:hypothetical protein
MFFNSLFLFRHTTPPRAIVRIPPPGRECQSGSGYYGAGKHRMP